jgi:esterase
MTDKARSKFTTANGMRMHYLDWDGFGGRTLLLLHGIGDTAHVWDHVAEEASRFLRIIAPDQRGHGLSAWARPPAYTCDDYVADLEAFVGALDLTDVILMGHSMGALHATRYAALHPEKVAGLVHVDIEACPPAWNKKYLLNLYEKLPHSYGSIKDYAVQSAGNSPYAEESLLYAIASTILERGEDGRFRPRYDREVLYHFDRYDLRSCLKDIKCPSLMIRGEESRVMSESAAREMSRAIPAGAFVSIPRAAHPVHTDNPRVFCRTVLDFLKDKRLI